MLTNVFFGVARGHHLLVGDVDTRWFTYVTSEAGIDESVELRRGNAYVDNII